MKPAEIKLRLRELADMMIEDGGVSVTSLSDMFRSATDPNELLDLGAEALYDLVSRYARDVLNDLKRSSNGQMTFPGILGEVDETVTTLNAEGGYVLKYLRHATVADLLTDVRLHEENVVTARKALDRAERRNEALVPLMESQGFETVAEALAHLGFDEKPSDN